ncbi:MAG: protein translocase subunit SecDF [Bacteroidota bacterium]
MQNRSLLWVFILLLTLSVGYMLSFSWIVRDYEAKIKEAVIEQLGDSISEGDPRFEAKLNKALQDSTDAVAFMGYTYGEIKQKELNLGLDLRGGMSITLEVSIPDLLVSLSDFDNTPEFVQAIENAKGAQRNSTQDYITLFNEEWKKSSNGKKLSAIFSLGSPDKFKLEMTDEEVIAILRKEATDAIDNTENIIRKRIDQFGVAQPNVQKQALSNRIVVELPGIKDDARISKNLKSTANLEFWNTYFNAEVAQALVDLNDALGKKLAPELWGITSTPVDTTKTDSTAVAPAAKPDDQLTDEEKRKKNPLFALIQPIFPKDATQLSPVIAQAAVSSQEAVNNLLRSSEAKSILPGDLRLLWGAKAEQGIVALYAIKTEDPNSKNAKPRLTGKNIQDARPDIDPTTGDVVVEMSMDLEGAAEWRDMTKINAQDNRRAIAVVMDSLVYSAPSVNEEIPNGRSVITFGTAADRDKQMVEAQDLAGLLKAGSLPAPAKIVDKIVVGPSLGDENIKAGLWSFIAAFIVIMLYMMFYYAWAGWAANVALIANLFFLIGALVSIGGSLTLPGIAGIVLTMGMAVDANVLIYERVKEELRRGKGISAAMKDGFLKAISAILDGNATTLITGIVLFVVGTGPIKGFATTLIIGIFTTLFTAIIISRLILYRRLDNKKEITFYSNITKNWFTKMNYDFVSKRFVYYTISVLIIGAGVWSWTSRGFNMGVDFAGGTSMKVKFEQAADAEQVRAALASGLVENGASSATTVQAIGNTGNEFKLTTNYLINDNSENVDEKVSSKVDEVLNSVGKHEITTSYKVDASMSDDFRTEAYWSAIIALLLVGIYIVFRFRKLDFAIGAVVALFHDALVVICAFTLLNGLVPFTLEVNQNFIGAILTVIGYSINDTVVIFDRIREYLRERKDGELKSTINDALNSTMGRSINTSMTVLLTLLVMFIFGSDDIKGFCFAMIVGVLSGVYSTLFIATPIVVDMRNLFSKKK